MLRRYSYLSGSAVNAKISHKWVNDDGLVHDCRNSIANALELLQACGKPPICFVMVM